MGNRVFRGLPVMDCGLAVVRGAEDTPLGRRPRALEALVVSREVVAEADLAVSVLYQALAQVDKAVQAWSS